MREKTLSDHTADMLAEESADLDEAMAVSDRVHTLVHEAERRYRIERRGREAWRRLFFLPTPRADRAERELEREDRRLYRTQIPEKPIRSSIARWEAGDEGERMMADALGAKLDDDWVLFKGYRNRKGETDGLLVGPHGVWAIEVKNTRGVLVVDGDDWQMWPLDRSGTAEDARNTASDKSGRSWGRQVTDVADALNERIHDARLDLKVRTTVLLVHHKAEIGKTEGQHVDLILNRTRQLLTDIKTTETRLDDETRHRLEELIERDHARHNPGYLTEPGSDDDLE